MRVYKLRTNQSSHFNIVLFRVEYVSNLIFGYGLC